MKFYNKSKHAGLPEFIRKTGKFKGDTCKIIFTNSVYFTEDKEEIAYIDDQIMGRLNGCIDEETFLKMTNPEKMYIETLQGEKIHIQYARAAIDFARSKGFEAYWAKGKTVVVETPQKPNSRYIKDTVTAGLEEPK